jgi:asparagine synthase (glutamine-hydrolysing)
VSVDAARFDEAGVAAASARHFGSRHHVLKLDAHGAAESLDAFVAAMDVPSVDGFNTWTVSRLARSHGMKVVLSGLGGDEVFGGYPTFARVPRLARMARLARKLPPVADLAGGLIERHARSSPARRVGGLLRSPGTYHDAYRAYRGIFPPADARRLAEHFAGAPRAMARTDRALPAGWPRDPADRVSHLELTGYMRNQLLRDSDVMSMAHGLELRLPLVDQRLFDTVAPIAPGLRLQAGKRLLTSAVDDIPDAVRLAPKRGFSFPFEAWFGERLDARMGTPGTALPVRATEWYQRWTLFVFLRWLDARQREAAA